ncbi:MAG: aspartyl protease family protein [Gammaproteobacteria bacterium]
MNQLEHTCRGRKPAAAGWLVITANQLLEEPRAQRLHAGWKAVLLPVLLLVLVLLTGCGPVVGKAPGVVARETVAGTDARIGEFAALYDRRDYFELRARLASMPRSGSPVEDLFRALVQAAFNDAAGSNATLAGIEAAGMTLPDSLTPLFHRTRFRNHLRLHEYENALHAARELLALPAVDSAVRADVRNAVPAMEALRDAPPQRVLRRADSHIRRGPNARPIQIGDSARTYGLDTGANFSVMMRSEARALGLRIRKAAVQVGTATDIRVEADVAVADRVRIGAIELSNVVFLVIPDEALTFQGGRNRIPGLIGFPVIEALGEVRFRGDSVVSIPAEPPEHSLRNMALEALSPLIQVGIFGDTVICALDTGAGATSFYAPSLRSAGEYVINFRSMTLFLR